MLAKLAVDVDAAADADDDRQRDNNYSAAQQTTSKTATTMRWQKWARRLQIAACCRPTSQGWPNRPNLLSWP